MTGTQRSASEGYVCPNCHALNNPNAEICVSCGIHFQIYDEVKQELSQRKNDRQDQFRKAVHEVTHQKLDEDQKKLETTFIRQILFLIIIGIILVPILWGLIKLAQYQKIRQQQILQSNYQNGLDCLEARDFNCAEGYFQKVYSKDKTYQGVLKNLVASKIGRAEELYTNGQISLSIDALNEIVTLEPQNLQALQLLDAYHKYLGYAYKEQGNWQKSIDEFNYALESMPEDFEAQAGIDAVYNSWIKEETARRSWIKVWQLKQAQKAFDNK
jgi:tetratricopeptide (TPR) repeat protein